MGEVSKKEHSFKENEIHDLTNEPKTFFSHRDRQLRFFFLDKSNHHLQSEFYLYLGYHQLIFTFSE